MTSPPGLRVDPSRAQTDPWWAHWLRVIRSPSGAIYGTLVASAVLSTEASTRDGVGEIALVVLGTLVVYWFAHGYSEMLPERARHRAAGGRVRALTDLGRALRNDWSIVGGCGSLLTVFLVSAWLGASTNTAVDLALGFAVIELLVWGLLAARWADLHGWAVVAYGLGSAGLGLLIGSLKVLVQH